VDIEEVRGDEQGVPAFQMAMMNLQLVMDKV